jgi:hypothetical protein
MNSWFDIIKTQRTVTDIGFDFDLPEEEEPEKDEDKFPCCEEARKKTLQMINSSLTKRTVAFVKEANCEDLYWKIKALGRNTMRPDSINNNFNEIISKWGNCVALLHPDHIEQMGWHTTYKDVE